MKQVCQVQQGGSDADVLRPERLFLDRQGAAHQWLSRLKISGSLLEKRQVGETFGCLGILRPEFLLSARESFPIERGERGNGAGLCRRGDPDKQSKRREPRSGKKLPPGSDVILHGNFC